MTNKFANALKNQDALDSLSVTEKGALGYARTGSRLVDFFFQVGSMRTMPEDKVVSSYAEAYAENPGRALELLFFIRDCRGGVGEKRVFRICFDWLLKNYLGDALDLMGLIPEYGSWKAFLELTNSFQKNEKSWNKAVDIVSKQFSSDVVNASKGNSISLLAKWLPSENTSSSQTRKLSKIWRTALNLEPKFYRKALSMCRSKIRIVESQMSSNNWGEIDYNAVPAKAGMNYRNAFLRHDEDRRRAWLAALKNGSPDVKINTSGLTIPEMVAKYVNSAWYGSSRLYPEDPTIEAAWRDLVSKNRMPDNAQAMIPIIDGSGSMFNGLPGNCQPIHVSMGLGLFLANINSPKWRGMCIEFGSNPSFFQVPVEASLHDQLAIAIKHNDCGCTNVKAVFDLILRTAKNNVLSQEDIPQLVTFSDMEFDTAYPASAGSWRSHSDVTQERLFETISREYAESGFKLPKMIFWNICSRSGTIPVIENELGVALLSGFSQSIMDMVLSRKLDPLSILLEKLDSPRYNLVREALERPSRKLL